MVQAVVFLLLAGLRPSDLTDLPRNIDHFLHPSIANVFVTWHVFEHVEASHHVKAAVLEVERGEDTPGSLTGHVRDFDS